jgi:hypothetical protein
MTTRGILIATTLSVTLSAASSLAPNAAAAPRAPVAKNPAGNGPISTTSNTVKAR